MARRGAARPRAPHHRRRHRHPAPPLLLLLLLALLAPPAPAAAATPPGNCTKRTAVVFTGEARGDEATWASLAAHLVAPNDADVLLDVWDVSPEARAALERIFRPCEFYTEAYNIDWKRSVVEKDPRFQLLGDTLYAIGPGETAHVVDEYARMAHAGKLLQRHGHAVVIRARLDARFAAPFPLPPAYNGSAAALGSAAPPPRNSVVGALEWGGRMYDAGEGPPTCPKMMSDNFAYGDFWGMRAYLDVFPHMFRLLEAMHADAGFRLWWATGNARVENTFLGNAESFVAWRLRATGVACAHAAEPFCLVRHHADGQWLC
jgi:hypothetical protein